MSRGNSFCKKINKKINKMNHVWFKRVKKSTRNQSQLRKRKQQEQQEQQTFTVFVAKQCNVVHSQQR